MRLPGGRGPLLAAGIPAVIATLFALPIGMETCAGALTLLVVAATLWLRHHRQRRQILLVPYPGGDGRVAMLQRLISAMPHLEFAVLLPDELSRRYGWTRAEVGADNFLCYEGAASGRPTEQALDAVLRWPKRSRVAGILCYDEYGLELSSQLSLRLGLRGTSPQLLGVLRDKHAFRRACADAGMHTVRHMPCTQEAVEAIASGEREWPFPSILKPRSGAGSECVLKIETATGLRDGWATVCARMGVALPSTASRAALSGTVEWSTFDERIKQMGFVLEEFFDGVEVDIDGWASDGHVDFALVAENRAPIEPTMDEVGGTYPIRGLSDELVHRLEALPQRVLDAAVLAAAAAGGAPAACRFHGCFHFEARVDPRSGEVMPIEWNARVGGAECPESVEAASGHWLPLVAAELALAPRYLPPPNLQGTEHTVVSANIHLPTAGRLTALQLGEEIDRAKLRLVSLRLFTSQVGSMYMPGRGSASCLGWLAAGGASKVEATANLRRVLEGIIVELEGERVSVDVLCRHIRM